MGKKTLSEQEVQELILGDPRDLLKKTSEFGIRMDDIKFDAKKYLANNIPKENLDAVDFVFWVAYFIEKSAEDLIIDPQVIIGASRLTMKILVEELNFGSKINVIEKLYVDKKDPLIKIMRKIQDLRNHVAHGRFHKLTYAGYPLNKGHGQILIIGDIKEAFKNAKK